MTNNNISYSSGTSPYSPSITAYLGTANEVIFANASKHVLKPQLHLFSTPVALFYYFFQTALFWFFARSFTLIQTDSRGIKYCYRNNELHNERSPAIYSPEFHMYVRKGVFHREDGPAVVYFDRNTEYWLSDGVLHREDGPAVTVNGAQHWMINGNKLSDEEIEQQKFKVFFSHGKNLVHEG